jgi:hypothetical protein
MAHHKICAADRGVTKATLTRLASREFAQKLCANDMPLF